MKLAAIRIRGITGIKSQTVYALETIGLDRKHTCVVFADTPVNRGQLQKCKDFITYGVIDEATEKLLIEKRGLQDPENKTRLTFTLHPPRGGFERKGIKVPFASGGVLGDRKEKMGELIRKML